MFPSNKNESQEPKDEPVKTDLAKVAAKGFRLASLDFYRGLIMILLMLESTGLYEHLSELTNGQRFSSTNNRILSSSLAGLAFLGSDSTGMNSVFIYVFSEIVVSRWPDEYLNVL